MIPITLTKDELLDRLRAQHRAAMESDKARLAAHREAERAFHEHIKTKARELARMSYAEIKEIASDNDGLALFLVGSTTGYGRYRHPASPPSCPFAQAPEYVALIEQVQLSDRTTYELVASGKYQTLHAAVVRDFNPAPRKMC